MEGDALDHRAAQDQVGHHHRLLRVVEGQHIGRVVLAAVLPIERSPCVIADDADRDLRRRCQRVRDPSCNS